jgi:hypothetical protein
VQRRTARQVRHRIELIGADGRLLYCLAPAEYWRFYWPQEYVDFFRFKEEYLLAHPWPRPASGPGDLPPHHVSRAAGSTASSLFRLDIPDDLSQGVLRASVARMALSDAEWRQFIALRASDDKITAWLYGRLAAKDYVRARWWQVGASLFPADLEVEMGDGGHAVVRREGFAPASVKVMHEGSAVIAKTASGDVSCGRRELPERLESALS